jgi:bacteriorhodopsin
MCGMVLTLRKRTSQEIEKFKVKIDIEESSRQTVSRLGVANTTDSDKPLRGGNEQYEKYLQWLICTPLLIEIAKTL